jgi:hypothetical protein
MHTTLLAPQVKMTTPFAGAAWQQDCNFKLVEHAEDRKRPLSMKWVVVTDEHGNRELRMRWTVARPFLPVTVCNATRPQAEPAVGWGCAPTPSPQARVAIP